MEFDPSILVGELPFDRNWICVFLFEVGLYFPSHFLGRFEPSVQASSCEKSDFDLRHVQPASVRRFALSSKLVCSSSSSSFSLANLMS